MVSKVDMLKYQVIRVLSEYCVQDEIIAEAVGISSEELKEINRR